MKLFLVLTAITINIAKIEAGGWVKVLGQAGGVFNNINFKNKNPGNPSASLFSILDTVHKYRWHDGAFRFKLCYPDGCIEWKQTSNPVTQTSVTGYHLINDNDFPGRPFFGGLAYKNEGTCAYLQSPPKSPSGTTTTTPSTSQKPCWWGVAQTRIANGKLDGPGKTVIRNALFVLQEDCQCPDLECNYIAPPHAEALQTNGYAGVA